MVAARMSPPPYNSPLGTQVHLLRSCRFALVRACADDVHKVYDGALLVHDQYTVAVPRVCRERRDRLPDEVRERQPKPCKTQLLHNRNALLHEPSPVQNVPSHLQMPDSSSLPVCVRG